LKIIIHASRLESPSATKSFNLTCYLDGRYLTISGKWYLKSSVDKMKSIHCWQNNQDSSISIETMLCVGQLEFNSQWGQWWDFFLFATMYRLALWSTKVLIQWFPGVVYLGVKGC